MLFVVYMCFHFLIPDVCAESPEPSVSVKKQLIGHSVAKRPIYAEIMGEGSESVLFLASVHGNEWVGTPLLFSLQKFLLEHPSWLDGKKIILIPMLNPDGWIDDMRSNRRRVDLNRNFPSDNYGRGLTGEYPLSEPETQALKQVLDTFQPGLIISIHQPYRCVDYDGEESRDLASKMAISSGLPLKKLGSRSGSLGAFSQGKYALITLELPYDEQYKDADKLWSKYGEALLWAVVYPKSPASLTQ